MGALPPTPPVTFSQQLEKVTKESRRQTSFPQIYDACRLKVLNSRSALKHTDFLNAAFAVNLGHIRNGGKEKAVGTLFMPPPA